MRSQSCWLIIQVPWLIVTTHSFIVSLTSISCFFPRCNYPARSGFSSWFHTYIIDNITYIYVSPPPGPTHVSISLTVSLQGQPFAICYLKKKKTTNTKKQPKNNALESLLPSPHPKVCHPKRFFLFFGGCFSYFCWVCSRLIQAKSDSFGL